MAVVGNDAEPIEVILYLDYHGVLDAEGPDLHSSICDILVQLDHMPYEKDIILLSKASAKQRRIQTLEDIDSAGVLDLFDAIVFTSERTAIDHSGNNYSTRYNYPRKRPGLSMEYIHSGKDQYMVARINTYMLPMVMPTPTESFSLTTKLTLCRPCVRYCRLSIASKCEDTAFTQTRACTVKCIIIRN